jgi:hypothetical protein
MGEWLRSAGLFCRGVAWKGWAFFALVFLDMSDMFERYVQPRLPAEWRDFSLPAVIFWPLIGIGILWAVVSTYHDARMRNPKRLSGNVPLHEAISYLTGLTTEWALLRADGDEIAEAANKIRQLGRDGKLTIFGRSVYPMTKAVAGVVRPIEHDYWDKHMIDPALVMYEEGNGAIQTLDDPAFPVGYYDVVQEYADLQVNRSQLRSICPRSMVYPWVKRIKLYLKERRECRQANTSA